MKSISVLIICLCLNLIVCSVRGEEEHHFAVEIHSHANPDDLAERHGFENLGKVAGLENHYLFKLKPEHVDIVEEKTGLLKVADGVKWLEKQVKQQRFKKPRF